MSAAKRPRGVAADGMLLLDKPEGMTSNQALQHAKRLLGARKAGHTGSLDPIATGLLPLCFGETTRISSLFLQADKGYRTRLRLGITTDSGDREGAVQERREIAFTRAQLDTALEQFRGSIMQTPPMYSAVKHQGRRLYQLAREGVTVERTARPMTVHHLTVESWEGEHLELDLTCSSGFYVRVLAADLGAALGCGAHVDQLRRTHVGAFSISDAHTLDHIQSLDSPAARRTLLLPTERALAHLPALNLPDNLALHLCRGRAIRAPTGGEAPPAGMVRVYAESIGFLGLGEISEDRKITPRKPFLKR